jgi:hypothetical protein
VMETSPPRTTVDAFFRLLFPVVFLPLVAFIISYEIVYGKRVKKPVRLHVKRITVRIAFFLICLVSWGTILILLDSQLSPLIGSRWSVLISHFLWLGVFMLIFVRNRSFFRKL